MLVKTGFDIIFRLAGAGLYGLEFLTTRQACSLSRHLTKLLYSEQGRISTNGMSWFTPNGQPTFRFIRSTKYQKRGVSVIQ
jgi:hypothetical protein